MAQNPARGGRDHYPTPKLYSDWAVKRALAMSEAARSCTGHNPPMYVLEPGCGGGAPFLHSAVEQHPFKQALGVELSGEGETGKLPLLWYGRDFMTLTDEELAPFSNSRGKFDLIATNPPFSVAESFITKSLELLDPWGVMVFLLRLQVVGSEKRMHLWRNRPPHEIATFVRRISFDGIGTDYTEYACFFWLGEQLKGLGTRFYWVDNTSVKKRNVQTVVEEFGHGIDVALQLDKECSCKS